MLERQNYKQFIEQQGLLETNIAEGWGYKVNAKQFLYKPIKTPQLMKVAMIQPMKKIVDVPISKKLEKLQEELLMLENQKKLNKLTEQAKKVLQSGGKVANNDCPAVKMMHKRVQEYNFIIDHRHIIQKNSERARQILGIKQSKAQKLNQEVKALKDKLPSSSFSEMIEINKKIAQLYRNYQKKMFQSKETSQGHQSLRYASPKRSQTKKSISSFNSLQNSSKIQPKTKTQKNSKLGSREQSQSIKRKQKSKSISIKDLVIMQELNQSSQGGSSRFAQGGIIQQQIPAYPQSLFLDYGRLKFQKKTSEYATRKRLYTVMQKRSVEQSRKEKLNRTITESFIGKQILEKGKALDKRLRQNEDVIEVWRQRIDQNKQKNKAALVKTRPKAKIFSSSLKNTNNNSFSQQNNEEFQEMKKARQILIDRRKQARQRQNEKEKMFAIILRKKQSKFKRVPGTTLMQQADANQAAKKILGMNKTSTGNLHKSEKQKMNGRKSTNQTEEPEWLNIQNDEQIYQSQCRNEKLNILLKKNKK